MYGWCLHKVSCIFQTSLFLVISYRNCIGKYSLYFYIVPTGLWGFVPGTSKGSFRFEKRVSNVIIEILVLMC